VATRAPTLAAGGPGSPARPLAVSRARTGRRILLDRFATRAVVLGGAIIIASILAILFVIVGEIVPLFRSPEARYLGVHRPRGPGAAPAESTGLGVDEYREFAYRVTAGGALEFVPLRSPGPARATPIPGLDRAHVTAVVLTEGERYLIGTSDSRVTRADVKFAVSFDRGQRVVEPRVEFGEPVVLDQQQRPVRRLAFAEGGEGSITVGQVGPTNLVVLRVVERTSLAGDTTREEWRQRLSVADGGDVSALALDRRGDNLLVGTARGRLIRIDMRDPRAPQRAETAEVVTDRGAAVTALGFLLGDRTVVVGDQAGGVTTWQIVPPPTGGAPRLTRVHAFQRHEQPVTAVGPSQRDKGFATADASGVVHVHYGTTGATLLSLRAESGRLRALAIAPKADGVLAQHEDGALSHWELHNPHPEITLRALFGAVWYEGYSKPDYVWQSTGGTDDFEAKFSLTPLIYGTLKGTFYALLFAVPLALLAALYVSEFMHPDLKGYVKPVVEVMAALPSVVLGFLAGLWLAPIVERVVPGLFVLPIVLVVCILAALLLWQRLPAGIRSRVRPGSELVLLVPVVVAGIWLAFAVGGLIETGLLGGDYRGWLLSALGLTYDQRNSLVVGIAMGFAVIPIIFTIAEDSLANVPGHLRAGSLALGASRWQTAVRVVLPTASPGIFSAVMIGFGRAVGETMIVLMATGNTPVMDWSIFNGFRALSANIAVELPEAPEGGTLFRVLFLAAFLLFCLTFAVNTAAEVVRLQLRRRYRYL
jgi:phosphate transport system permease protein